MNQRLLIRDRHGQGAVEQMAVYGWALVVILVLGMLLWYLGIFSPSGQPGTGFDGFNGLVPVEWFCEADSGELTLSLTNTAGMALSNITIDETPCSPLGMAATDELTICTLTENPCCSGIPKGSRFDCKVSISYRSGAGQLRNSSGSVWGAAE